MAVITTGNHPKALWPGVNKFWGTSYEKHPLECMEIFDVKSSSKAYEEDVETLSFGLAPAKAQGAGVAYDSHAQGPTTRYTHVVYGLGYIVTKEEIDDNLYEKVSRDRAASLAFSMRTTKETVSANVLNRAFNSSYTGGDGVELISTAHVTDNGTQSNHLTVAADLSEASLEDLIIQINQMKNSTGLAIAARAQKMIIPATLEFEAQRILGSALQSGTANNDTNALRSMGIMPQGFSVNHYLTDTDAWFIKTDVENGLTMFDRTKLAFTRDNDFDTENAKAKCIERYSVGWTDWRSIFASPGA
jgi:hypothetical protein